MSKGLNRVELLGFLGADPELKVTSGGRAILRIRLATTNSYLDKNNTQQESTEWHSVTVWGKRGEALAKILSKGKQIYVEGSLHYSSFEKDGVKHYRTEINATEVILCGGRDGGAQGGGGGQRSGGGGRAPESPSGGGSDDAGDYDDSGDIPF